MADIVDNIPNRPRFVYWDIASRAQTPMLMLEAVQMEYEWDSKTANEWPSKKNDMPFGQLPALVINGKVIAQSGTISRYCAKYANLWPQTTKWIQVDMIMEHCNDIFNLYGKAKYSGDSDMQKMAWRKVENETLPEKLKWLEKMLIIDDSKYFVGNDVITAADISVFSVINLGVRAGLENCLDNFPKLKEHYLTVSQVGNIPNYLKQDKKIYFNAMKPIATVTSSE